MEERGRIDLYCNRGVKMHTLTVALAEVTKKQQAAVVLLTNCLNIAFVLNHLEHAHRARSACLHLVNVFR
jgi:hypothetical protein